MRIFYLYMLSINIYGQDVNCKIIKTEMEQQIIEKNNGQDQYEDMRFIYE